MGLAVKTGIGGHGLSALLRGKLPGKTLGIRADMDALNVREETGLAFASRAVGKMHACGHDSHMAMALGAAALLARRRNALRGNVKFIFQPAEEGPGGALPMIKAGVLKNPAVDAIIGCHGGRVWHIGKLGEVFVFPRGAMLACLDRIDVKIKGRGGHGAMPHETVDAISIAAHAVSTVQTVISREIKPLEPAVITIGKINGGSAYNVIAGEVVLEGTVRAFKPELRKFMARRIGEIFRGVARAMRGDCEYHYHFGYPPLINDQEFTKIFAGIAAKLLGARRVREVAEPVMGGEDMAYFLNEVPGTFFYLPTCPAKKPFHPHHHPKFDIDERILWLGSALFAATALAWQEPAGLDLAGYVTDKSRTTLEKSVKSAK
jgi:amidohydrolase